MMPPAFIKHSSAAFGHMDSPVQNSVYPRLDYVVPQHKSAMLNLPLVAESVVEHRLAQLVLQARLRAQARMANFFHMQQQQQQQKQQQQLPQACSLIAGMVPANHLIQTQPNQAFKVARRTSASVVSLDSSDSISRNSVCDKSDSGSLDDSLRGTSVNSERLYVETIRDTDVLCGRGGRSNHHPGNKRYRHVISEMKLMYKKTEAKSTKTDLSRTIVDHVCRYGGRFIKKEESTGRYYVLTRGEARKKTSQALRENKVLKWTG